MFDLQKYADTKTTKIYTFSADKLTVTFDAYDELTGQIFPKTISTNYHRLKKERDFIRDMMEPMKARLALINGFLSDCEAGG